MIFPQHGGCLCGDVRYRLNEDPLTLYACHCTDCQSETGASFTLTMVLRREAFEVLRGLLETYSIETPDGRRKSARYCGRCVTRIFGPSRAPGLAWLSPGTLDDTREVRPVGHIWTRSAQPWMTIPADALRFTKQPDDEGHLALVRAWKTRNAG